MHIPYINNRHHRYLFTSLATGMNEYEWGQKSVYLTSIFSQRKKSLESYDSAFEWWMQLEEVKKIYKREMETHDAEDFLASEL